MVQLHPFSLSARGATAHLRLIAVTDLHMRLMPYDYIRNAPVSGHGLALAAAEAEIARAEAANALLFDIGDAFEGSPMDNALSAAPPDEGHPMALALEAAGVDTATLGNHDFNQGISALERWIAPLKVPIVLANVVRELGATALDDTPLFPPVHLLKRALHCGDRDAREITIGLVGVVPPQTLEWDAAILGGALVARDSVDAVATWSAELRRQGADLVVVLCHSGISDAAAAPMMEHAAVPIAALPDVDVLLCGHAHDLFPSPAFNESKSEKTAPVDRALGRLHGKPAVMPGAWGSHLGLVDLSLLFADGRWVISDSRAELRPVRSESPHADVVAAITPHHEKSIACVRQPVAQSVHSLTTYFSQVTDTAALSIVNAAMTEAVRTALAGRSEANLPLLSATAPLKAGGLQGPENYTDIPAGRLEMRHVFDLYIYQNLLAAVCVTGEEVRMWLERSASTFRTIVPGTTGRPLLDPRQPGYNFDVVSGVTYRIDLRQPPLFDADGARLSGPGRIVDLAYDGRPVTGEDRFVLATNSYRLGQGGGFPRLLAGPLSLSPTTVRDVVLQHLKDGGAERPLNPPAWGFVPLPKTHVTFETGPGADLIDLPGSGGTQVSPFSRLGPSENGGLLFTLDLSEAGRLGPA